MLRHVWFPVRAPIKEDEIVEWSPFTLRLEFLQLSRGRLRLRARLALRNQRTTKLVVRYRLWQQEWFREDDGDVEERLRTSELREADDPIKAGLYVAWSWWLRRRVFRVTLLRLLWGMEVQGRFDELKALERALRHKADSFVGELEYATAFSTNEVRFYASGKRAPKQNKSEPKKPFVHWR